MRGASRRGQAHTLEAVVAGILLLSALVFALQVTAVTPLSASTASQHIENQHQSTAEGVLAVADDRGALERAILYWGNSDDDAEQEFHNADNGRIYVNSHPTNEFGELLHDAFGGRGITYNVYVSYELRRGDRVRQRMVYRGEPSDNAITASREVILFDDDVLYNSNEQPTTNKLGDSGTGFFAPDAASNSGVYNVVRVEVVVWRM